MLIKTTKNSLLKFNSNIRHIFQQLCFISRYRESRKLVSYFRKLFYGLLGMRTGKGTLLSSVSITWPHQVSIGKKCILEKDIFFKYDGIWKEGPSIIIGDEVFIGKGCEFNINCGIIIYDCVNIASGCKFIDHDHGITAGQRIGLQPSKKKEIIIGEDAWLGMNVIVLKGVTIGKGAVVGAGAVVTKSIADFEIWGGVPAKKIGDRK